LLVLLHIFGIHRGGMVDEIARRVGYAEPSTLRRLIRPGAGLRRSIREIQDEWHAAAASVFSGSTFATETVIITLGEQYPMKYSAAGSDRTADASPSAEPVMTSTTPQAAALSLSAEALYRMPDVELLTAYAEARRQFVEKKFTRDTHRARLEWIRARMFVGGTGGVTERNMTIDVSEEIARKGQELREMTRDLDLLKVDVDLIAIVIRLRGVSAPNRAQAEDMEGESDGHGTTTTS
jgi:hypothetical protein